MTEPLHCGDPAFDIVTKVIAVTRQMFSDDPTVVGCVPIGGGTKKIHFVTGEGPDWDPMLGRGDNSEIDCDNPFVWVRLVSRYISMAFPEPDVALDCQGVETLSLEIGVGRCVNIDPIPNYDIIAQEAEWGLDDSFRLTKIPCILKGKDGLGPGTLVASEPVTPLGPDGGGVIWTLGLFIGINS